MGRQFRRWLKVNPLSFMVVSARLIWGFTLKAPSPQAIKIRDAKCARQTFHVWRRIRSRVHEGLQKDKSNKKAVCGLRRLFYIGKRH